MKFLRSVAKAIIVMLAVVGGFSVAAYVTPKGVSKISLGDAIVRFLPSPDGTMKAVYIFHAGGGAISPYCDAAVSVVPATASEADAQDAQFTVFTGGCDGFAVRDGAALNSPIVEWRSDTELKITSSINATLLTPAKVTMKKRDASRRVAIAYEAHE